MKKITLNEADLRYMIHKAINEVMSLEGEDETQYPSDRYYYGSGWDKSKYDDNPFTAEGPVGKGFEAFAKELKAYIEEKVSKPLPEERYLQSEQERLEEYLAMQKADFERIARKNPEVAARIESRNREKGSIRVWIYDMGVEDSPVVEVPPYLHSFRKNYKEYKREDFEKLVAGVERAKESLKRAQNRRNNMIIAIDMPREEGKNGDLFGRSRWSDFAQLAPKQKAVRIDLNDIEGSAAKAWDIFNEYASQTKEVIGWWAWQWSTFPPTIKPILAPEVGKIISGEEDNIRRFYSSYRSGDYVGD